MTGDDRRQPRYPVFIPSKGRAAGPNYTARRLQADAVPFRVVVEPSEEAAYREALPDVELLVLPRDNMGSVIPVRNWIRDLAEAEGHARHWQLDDNLKQFRRMHKGHRIPCHAGVGLRVCEEFSDRYTNVGVSGLNYQMFVPRSTNTPYYLNCHVYSCTLVNHAMPCRWRGIYNEDTDLCLQALAAGWCTVALNVYMADKDVTMKQSGGNTDVLYKGDGRLKMANSLKRQWPYVVETRRRFNRPQHVIRGAWRAFDHPLIRRPDIDWSALPAVDEFGVELHQIGTEVQSEEMRRLVDEWGGG